MLYDPVDFVPSNPIVFLKETLQQGFCRGVYTPRIPASERTPRFYSIMCICSLARSWKFVTRNGIYCTLNKKKVHIRRKNTAILMCFVVRWSRRDYEIIGNHRGTNENMVYVTWMIWWSEDSNRNMECKQNVSNAEMMGLIVDDAWVYVRQGAHDIINKRLGYHMGADDTAVMWISLGKKQWTKRSSRAIYSTRKRHQWHYWKWEEGEVLTVFFLNSSRKAASKPTLWAGSIK